MAVSPIYLQKAFLEEVENFEAAIDKALLRQTISQASITVNVPAGMSTMHIATLRQRYIDAGWKDVIYNSDQREGEWLEFKP